MAGVIDIVNQALSALGEARITSLDDPGQAAGLARSLYDSVRDAEIERHSWNFARTRIMLPALKDPPAFGWSHQYQLPSDCLRVQEAGPRPRALTEDFIAGENRAWLIEGRNLLTNQGPPLNLIYLRRVEDPASYPPAFVEVLAAKLAVGPQTGQAPQRHPVAAPKAGGRGLAKSPHDGGRLVICPRQRRLR